MSKSYQPPFKKLILLPIFLAFLVLIVITTILIYRFQRIHMTDDITSHLESVREITQTHVTSMSQTLSGILEFIKAFWDKQITLDKLKVEKAEILIVEADKSVEITKIVISVIILFFLLRIIEILIL